MSDANLTKAALRQANLEGADLSRATLDRAELTGARLLGANLSGAQRLDSVLVDWIDTGGGEHAQLHAEAARRWLLGAAAR